MPVKIATLQQRNNPNRKARLRKKLKVAEFTEYAFSAEVTFSEKDFVFATQDDSVDQMIDDLHGKNGIHLEFIDVHHHDGQFVVTLIVQSQANERSREATEKIRPSVEAYLKNIKGAKDVSVGEVTNAWYDE